MKLINPTDDELNAAFAEKVAGWKRGKRIGMDVWILPSGFWDFRPDQFTRSADAVLPWLEKMPFRIEIGKGIGLQCGVVICGYGPFTKWGEGGWFRGIDPIVPRAACIALLRAHGVEVEFTLP